MLVKVALTPYNIYIVSWDACIYDGDFLQQEQDNVLRVRMLLGHTAMGHGSVCQFM